MDLSGYKKRILKHKYFAVFLAATFILGIIIGIFLHTYLEKLFFTGNVINFYVNALTKEGSLAGLFFAGLFSDALSLVLFFGVSFVAALLPVYFIILFYRGYVLGLALGVFLGEFGVSGLMLFIFAVLIRNVLTSFALTLFAVLVKSIKSNCKNNTKERYTFFAISLVVALAGSIAQLVFLLFILRPLNFNF